MFMLQVSGYDVVVVRRAASAHARLLAPARVVI